jgi:hypothetical protein
MPRGSAIIFADHIGKLDALYVHCPNAAALDLVEERGRNAKLIDWLDEITADCPKKQAYNMNDPCRARCPDLPRVSLRDFKKEHRPVGHNGNLTR